MSKIGKLAVSYIGMGKSQAKKDSDVLMSSPILGLISSERDDRQSQLQVGQVYQRLSLLAASKISDSVQWFDLWLIGAVWTAMTVCFEFGYFHFVAGVSWEMLLADYNLFAGRLWVLVLLTTLCGSAIIAEIQNRLRQQARR